MARCSTSYNARAASEDSPSHGSRSLACTDVSIPFRKDAWNCRSISRRYWSCRSAITKASMSSLWAVEIKPAAAIGWSWKSRCYSSLSYSLA